MRDNKGRFIKGNKASKPKKNLKKEISRELQETDLLDPTRKNSLQDLEAAAAYYKKMIAEGHHDYWDKLVEVSKFKLPYEKPRISSIASQEDVVTDISVSWEMTSPISEDHPLMKLIEKDD